MVRSKARALLDALELDHGGDPQSLTRAGPVFEDVSVSLLAEDQRITGLSAKQVDRRVITALQRV